MKGHHFINSQSCVYAPLVWVEHNHHGGIHGRVSSPMFRDHAQVVIHFPPLHFDTHKINQMERQWTMIVKQRSSISRPQVKFVHYSGFGFRLRLPPGLYHTLEDVFTGLTKCIKVEMDEHGMIGTTVVHERKPEIMYRDHSKAFHECMVLSNGDVEAAKLMFAKRIVRGDFPEFDFNSLLKAHNEQALKNLGDWRPETPEEPAFSNVIDFKEFARRITVAGPHTPIDFDGLVANLK